MTVIWLLMAMASALAPTRDAKPPAQAARGQAIFFDENVVMHCGVCHSLGVKANPPSNRGSGSSVDNSSMSEAESRTGSLPVPR
jgi:mono/diheme cytochrome c family protein